jgi:hypothetical protein
MNRLAAPKSILTVKRIVEHGDFIGWRWITFKMCQEEREGKDGPVSDTQVNYSEIGADPTVLIGSKDASFNTGAQWLRTSTFDPSLFGGA